MPFETTISLLGPSFERPSRVNNVTSGLCDTDFPRSQRYVLIETLAEIEKSETTRPCGQKFETPRHKEHTKKRDFVTHQKGFRDFEIRPKFSETQDFLGTIRHPFISSWDEFLPGMTCISSRDDFHLGVWSFTFECLHDLEQKCVRPVNGA